MQKSVWQNSTHIHDFFKKYTVSQLGIERNFLNLGHFGKIIPSIILMMKYWRLSFQGREQEGIFSPLLFNIVHGSYGHWNNGRKRSKKHTVWKEESTTLFTDNMIAYKENSKKCSNTHTYQHHHHQEFMSKLSKVSENWKSTYKKSIVFLQSSNEQLERKI